jgi:hypothetical protein
VTDLAFDGNIKVQWVPAIANIAAPATATEILAAGSLSLELRIVPDGLTINPGTDDIDNSALGSTFTTATAGRRKFDISVKLKRGTLPATDDKWYTTLIYLASGFLVVRRNLAVSAAFAAAQLVEVYPVICGEIQPDPPGPSKLQTAVVPMMVTSDPRAMSNPATLAA